MWNRERDVWKCDEMNEMKELDMKEKGEGRKQNDGERFEMGEKKGSQNGGMKWKK